MGRKSEEIESLLETSQRRAAESAEKQKKKSSQWDDLNKFVPVYELNQNAELEAAAEEELKERKRRMPKLRCDGQSSAGIRLSDVQREAIALQKAKNQKRMSKQYQQQEQKRRYESLQNADILGNGNSNAKRARVETKVNGSQASPNGISNPSNGAQSKGSKKTKSKKVVSESSDESDLPEIVGKKHNTSNASDVNDINTSNTFIELDQLKPGPIKTVVEYEEETYTKETEEVTDYIVTTPSEDEEQQNQSNKTDDSLAGIPTYWRVCYRGSSDESDDVEDEEDDLSTDESFGIDLNETDNEEDEDETMESNMDDFIANDNEIEYAESSDDEIYLKADLGRGGGRKAKPKSFRELSIVESYASSDDSDYSNQTEEDEHKIERLSQISADEINDLLQDLEEDSDQTESDTVVDTSDEERYQSLDPRALELKPIGLSIDGYLVNEEAQRFVEIQRDSEVDYAPKRFELFCFSEPNEHSVNTSVKALKWLTSPIGVQDFFEHIYTQRGVIIHRSDAEYYENVFSASAFYEMFQKHVLDYGINVNIANYKDGIRTTHNPDGRAYSGAIRSFINSGYSIQCVNPQTFNENIHYICDVLQELYGCFVGANWYVTTLQKGSSGFAPHYDDIDAFMIQTAGRKHWTIYAPLNDDQWPMESSGNFTQEEMAERADQIVFDGWLESGDMLYLPRGYIHCAKTDTVHDSLHVTISVAQKHSISDLLLAVTNKMLQSKIEGIPQLRRNLPVDLLSICGVAEIQYESEDQFLKVLERPMTTYLHQFLIGLNHVIPAAVDDLAKGFMRKALPPLLTDYEKAHSIHGLDGQEPVIPVFKRKTQVRLIRKHTQRLLFESESKAYLIHRMQNSMVYEGNPEIIVDIPEEFIVIVETLGFHYPEWDEIEELGSDLSVNKAAVQFLYEKGLLLVRDGSSQAAKKKRKVVRKMKAKKEAIQMEPEDLNDVLMEIDYPDVGKKKKTNKKQVKTTGPKKAANNRVVPHHNLNHRTIKQI
ncbi:Bifunctional lysine-specific demethylase and histidyl-hydroxylase [Aphelenchoides besseyi]|nr:Bifunctional lysine-specific demethylase and histidyl-hydroxylase [Aphelenchoides besseyi]